jgi:hypothetical protein
MTKLLCFLLVRAWRGPAALPPQTIFGPRATPMFGEVITSAILELLIYPVSLELSPGIICRRCQLHGEIEEAVRLAVKKPVGRERVDGGHRAP